MNVQYDTDFEKVCELDELTIGRPALAEVGGIPMAIVRTAEDQVHAIHDVCTHANVSLSEGELDGCQLECWLHGSRSTCAPARRPGRRPPCRSPSIPCACSTAPST